MWTEAAIETSETIGARRKKREQHRCGARRAVAQRRDRQGKPDRHQAYRQRALFGAPSAAGEHGAAAAAGDRSHRSCFMEAGRRPRPPAREEADMALCRGRGWRDVEGGVRGYPRRRLPMAARRSNERGFRLLRPSDGAGPLLLRRTLPNGLQAAEFAGLGRGALRRRRVHGCLKPPQWLKGFERDGRERASRGSRVPQEIVHVLDARDETRPLFERAIGGERQPEVSGSLGTCIGRASWRAFRAARPGATEHGGADVSRP